MVEDEFRGKWPLTPVETTVTFPRLRVRIDPWPQEIAEVWAKTAARMRGYRTEPILTRFGKKVSEYEAFKFATYLTEQEEDPEVKAILKEALDAWEKDIRDWCVRGHFDPFMYLARALLHDPSWYKKSVPLVDFHPLPDFDVAPSFSDLLIPTSGNTGFWKLESWNKASRGSKGNDLFHKDVFKTCRNWMDSIDKLPRITLAFVKSVSPPLAGFDRAQGRGRIVWAVSKAIAFWEMKVMQGLQAILDRSGTVWYACGDRINRMRQMLAVIRGDPGIHSADGDDFIVAAADGIVSGDASSFDSSVGKEEHKGWLAAIEEVLPEDIFRWYKACCYAGWSADAAINVGMLRRVPMQGVVSGAPSTHPEDTWVESGRIMSCDWAKKSELGIQQLNKYGVYRKDRQFILDYTATMSQLVVSEAYPAAIFGIAPRAIRALREREKTPADGEGGPSSEDGRIVAVLSNLYGGAAHERACEWVRERWQIRAPSKVVLMYARMLGRHRQTGTYERKALAETFRILTE